MILPLTVLRRLDCVLAPTKTRCSTARRSCAAEGFKIWTGSSARPASPSTPPRANDFDKLRADAPQLAANLRNYIAGFSQNMREVLERFDFDNTISKLNEAGLLFKVLERFKTVDLRYTPPRPLEEIEADIRAIETDIMRMLSEVTGGPPGRRASCAIRGVCHPVTSPTRVKPPGGTRRAPPAITPARALCIPIPAAVGDDADAAPGRIARPPRRDRPGDGGVYSPLDSPGGMGRALAMPGRRQPSGPHVPRNARRAAGPKIIARPRIAHPERSRVAPKLGCSLGRREARHGDPLARHPHQPETHPGTHRGTGPVGRRDRRAVSASRGRHRPPPRPHPRVRRPRRLGQRVPLVRPLAELADRTRPGRGSREGPRGARPGRRCRCWPRRSRAANCRTRRSGP